MVVKTPKEFLQDALTNNSFSIDDTDRALRMTLDHSFSYLYRLQRNMACYEELFYTTRNVVGERDYGDFWMDKRERICVNFPVQLIPAQFREKYRTSEFYNREIAYEDIPQNRTLFTRLPVVIIDNQVVRTFTFEAFDDYFTAHLGFDRYFLHTKKFDNNRWEYEYISHTTSVQVVANSEFTDIETNTGMLQKNSYSGIGYDRLRISYLENFGFALRDDGGYFAVLFLGDDALGTQLLETDVDTQGDLYISYDSDTLAKLNAYTGTVTVRLYFYRNLKKYTSYRNMGYQDSQVLQVRTIDGTNVSDAYVIDKDDGDNYLMPIPTENLLLFRTSKGDNLGRTPGLTHYPNSNVTIHYPNIYQVTDNLETKDRFKVYYFYLFPYDLDYDYMYPFFRSFMEYKWESLPYEKSINVVLLGDLTLIMDDTGTIPNEYLDLLNYAAAYHSLQMVQKELLPEEYAGEMYYTLTNVRADNFEEEKLEVLSRIEEGIESDLEIPEEAKRFAEVFDFAVNHPIVDYFYDEVDYLRNYEDTTHPFQYKVEKLKSFIKDDYRALTNYVRAQNKVGFKYEFSVQDIDLASRYRTNRESGEPFKEPMYVFPIQKTDPNSTVSARIFIDGLLCATFALEQFGFTDFFYVPTSYVNEDSYIEIEVFHCYIAETSHVFTLGEPSVELEFPATDDIKPTITDLYFYEGDTNEDTLDRIEKEKFQLEFITDRYNYYVDEDTPIQIFYKVCPHGDKNLGPYYDINGNCFTFEGQPDPANNITAAEVSELKSTGKLVEDVGYMTDNHLMIVRLEDVVTYDKVVLGASTLQDEDNKGLLYSDITKVRITLLDKSLFDKTITIAIDKKPMYKGSKMYTVTYPFYDTPIPNSQDAEEYTRAFKNGRLLSKNRYDFTDYFDGVLGIQMLEKLTKNETMAFDITPYRNRLVYFKEELDSDLIDLRGYINKPFDSKFYEVYLNGRRLNRTNIFPISPWEIKLAGLHSIYNLEIYEKDRDWEYYGINFSNYYTLSDFIREPFVDEDIAKKLVEDVIGETPPNVNDEEKMPWERELDLISVYFEIFYYMKLIPMHFVTADEEQFSTDEIAAKYPVINGIYHVTNDFGEDVLFLNPDFYYHAEDGNAVDPIGGTEITEPGEDEDPTDRWRVFLLGNTVTDDLDSDESEDDNDYWEGG